MILRMLMENGADVTALTELNKESAFHYVSLSGGKSFEKKQRKREFRELRAAERDLGKCGRWSDPALGEQTEHVSLLIIFIMIIFIKIMIIFFMIMISGEQAEHAGVGSLARGRLSRPHRHCQQLA